MKLITKLQSYTDVITNSSSTVFIMNENSAKFYEKDTPNDCCSIDLIDEQWLRSNYWEWRLVCDFLDVPYEEVAVKVKRQNKCRWEPDYYWDGPDEDCWNLWIDLNIERLQKELFGLYYVDIEDHFEDAYDYIDSAGSDALISDYRH